jgi:hypothetical protein
LYKKGSLSGAGIYKACAVRIRAAFVVLNHNAGRGVCPVFYEQNLNVFTNSAICAMMNESRELQLCGNFFLFFGKKMSENVKTQP